MKKWLLLLLIPLFLSCAGFQIDRNEDKMVKHSTEVLVGIAVREISYEVCKIDDQELTDGIVNLYVLVKDGEFTQDAIDQLARLTKSRPTLGPAIGDLIELLGQPIHASYKPVILTESILQRIENKWLEGQRLCLM